VGTSLGEVQRYREGCRGCPAQLHSQLHTQAAADCEVASLPAICWLALPEEEHNHQGVDDGEPVHLQRRESGRVDAGRHTSSNTCMGTHKETAAAGKQELNPVV